MGKGKVSSTLISCIAVGLVAIIAIVGVAVYGSKNFTGEENKNSASSGGNNSSKVDTADTSSQPTSSSDGSQVTGSTNTASSSKNESTSKASSSNTSSITQVTSKDLPTPDDNPFGVDNTECERVCYLTFDDGPGAYTDSVLETLKKNNVKATFFVVGTMGINKINKIYNAGHAIGLHTNTHELNKLYASPEAFIKDLTAVSDVVYNKTGIRSNLTRFPGGSATAYSKLGKTDFETVKEILKEKGYTYFDWNIDSGDTHSKSPSNDYVIKQISNNLTSKGELKDEICILFHDIKSVTGQVLDEVIKDLKDKGYTFKVLSSECDNFAFK